MIVFAILYIYFYTMAAYESEKGDEGMGAAGGIMLILGYLGGLLNVVMTILVILACIKYLRKK